MVKRGGPYRKRVFGVKSILDPSCTDIVDLCKTVLKKSDIKSMLKQPEFDALRKEVVNQFIANLTIDVKMFKEFVMIEGSAGKHMQVFLKF